MVVPTKEEKLYRLALSLVPGIGAMWLKKLLTYFGSAEKVFEVARKSHVFLPYKIAKSIYEHPTLDRARAIMEHHQQEGIIEITLEEPDYPQRLLELPDSPMILYYKGNHVYNNHRAVAIIGTRQLSPYGQEAITKFVQQLLPYRPLIVSGLAYGTDIFAHKQALAVGLPTVAVLPTSIDQIYPAMYKNIALGMCTSGGGLMTEYPIGTNLAAYSFIARNRIIAGLADVIVVIEAKEKSGALITAYYANNYHREVFALPGSIFSSTAKGCHQLIKRNQAHLLTDIDDLAYLMNWEIEKTCKKESNALYRLTQVEQLIVNTLKEYIVPMDIDVLIHRTQLPQGELQAALLSLELQGLLSALPGKQFVLIKRSL